MGNSESHRFTDREYHTTMMKVVAGVSLVATAVLAISTALAGFWLSATGLFAGCLVSGVAFVMVWRGNFYWPRILLPLIAIVLTIYLLIVGDGIRDEGVLGIPLAITLAGLLLGRKGVVGYTVFGMAALILVGWAQMQGWVVPDVDFGFIGTSVVIQEFQILFIGALVYITIEGLKKALGTVHEREMELAKSNQSLLEIQSALENRIAERVRNLRIARDEAETARREVERQAWQTTGLAQLGDVMSGEQDISDLSSGVIRCLCHYLNAPAGALFLQVDDQLQLSGCYACERDWAPAFKLGEGVVGQAAQERQMILLTDIPPDAVRISTGFGEMLPSQVIAVPFLFNQSLIGVFVIGTVNEFSDVHLTFLQNAAERVGVAFHTALAREKIDRLLETTRQQAEELQRREEELRAVNEELQSQVDHLSA